MEFVNTEWDGERFPPGAEEREEGEAAEETLTLSKRDVDNLYILAAFMYGVSKGHVDIRAALYGCALAEQVSGTKETLTRVTELLGVGKVSSEELNARAEELGLPFRLMSRPKPEIIVGYEIS
jgi:hypothetical protein